MDALVSLDRLKRHLYIDGDDHDADLTDRAAEGTAIVVDYLKATDHGWTVETVPPNVRAAILLCAADLWERRGTGMQAGEEIGLTPTVKSILHRLRDPAYA